MRWIKIGGIVVFLLIFELLLYKIFSRRSLSFGCFDDCANYMAGYFMLQGKTLYSQIFYNHIMGMADLSFLVQKLHHSINMYDLVLTHRKIIMASSFLFGFLLMVRFNWKGFLFVVLYELSKFYVFGDRFLGESIAVYAGVYLVGLILEKFNNKKGLHAVDYILAGMSAFLIIFMREPYIPFALAAFGFLLFGKFSGQKWLGLAAFFLPLMVVLLTTDIPAFIFNDFTVNAATAIKGEVQSSRLLGIGLPEMFLYPVFLLFTGKFNFFHYFLISLSIVFCVGIVERVIAGKKFFALILLLLLGLANIRVTPPGTTYFEAYHMMVWFGLFLFSAIYFATEFQKIHMRVVGLGIICIGWGMVVLGPGSYLYDKIDLQEALLTNFGKVMQVGNVVHDLSHPSDTLFLDGADDMVYWQSGLFSPYAYSWYTSVMPMIPIYKEARIAMFKKDPPTFYYDYCSKTAPFHSSLPGFVKESYQQLYESGKPSCLYILKSKVPAISPNQWERAKEAFFTNPNTY
ncbi:MAG: hypothetical protein ACM3IJ_01210 [Candidatus Levyibacteriota bacterium]